MDSIIITTLLCFLVMVSPTTALLLRPNGKLIQKACDHTLDPKFCLINLSKTPQVLTATLTSSPLPLVVAIAESGLTHAHQLRDYASNKTAAGPAYAECAKLLDDTVVQIELAVGILKSPERFAEEGASDDASYSLMVSTDGVTGCTTKLDSVKVVDKYVEMSGKHVEVCSVAADAILTDMKQGREEVN